MSDTSQDVTVTVTIVCPYCTDRFPVTDEHALERAREHVDAHTIDGDDACADGA